MFVSLPKRLSGPVFRGRRLIAFAILLSALLSGIAATSAHAQVQNWFGTVEVSTSRLTYDKDNGVIYKTYKDQTFGATDR